MLLVLALRDPVPLHAELLRAGANIAGVVAVLALQSGVRRFIGRRAPHAGHAIAIAIVLFASVLGLDPHFGFLRVGLNSAVLAAIGVGIALDLQVHARERFALRQPVVLALPLWLAAAAFAGRGLRALFVPASVAAEMTTDSTLNVSSSFSYVVLALLFHATLAGWS